MADPLVIDESVPRRGVRAILTRGRGRITAATLDEFPDLVVVGRCGAGLDNIDVAAAAERGIAVVNAPGATTVAVAEHAVLLMLGLARRVVSLDTAVKAGRWSVRDGYTGAELRGKRLGVVGLGAIGRRVAIARPGPRHGRRLLEPVVARRRSRVDRSSTTCSPRPMSSSSASPSPPRPASCSTPGGSP